MNAIDADQGNEEESLPDIVPSELVDGSPAPVTMNEAVRVESRLLNNGRWRQWWTPGDDSQTQTGGPWSVTREFGRYHCKPLRVWLPLGLLGTFLLAGQLWMPELVSRFGNPFGDYLGLVRLAIMFIGAFAIFLAWPMYRPKDWNPKDDEELERARQQFKEHMSRHSKD